MYAPKLHLSQSAESLSTIGKRTSMSELRPLAGRTPVQMQPLVVPTIRYAATVSEHPLQRFTAGAKQSLHGFMTDTGNRVGALTPNEHITGRTSSPSRVANTVARKWQNPIPAIRRALNL